jgi:hypothetical protein
MLSVIGHKFGMGVDWGPVYILPRDSLRARLFCKLRPALGAAPLRHRLLCNMSTMWTIPCRPQGESLVRAIDA